ncbi:MAG: hypothetical protein GXY51_08540 [Bacteroidetes bacterium]|jgi:hypothetical protein|nr:hypothetical protein [Bacteroidota bacterium]
MDMIYIMLKSPLAVGCQPTIPMERSTIHHKSPGGIDFKLFILIDDIFPGLDEVERV